MKAEIHPKYNLSAVVKCQNCGHSFTTGATQDTIEVEICSKCHPFFTGKKVLIDTEGRVDRFRKKLEGAQGKKKKVRKKKTLEDRVNEEIAVQLSQEAAAEEKEKKKKADKKAKAKKPGVAPEPEVTPEVAETEESAE